MKLLGDWIKIKSENATIANIVKALEDIDHFALADSLSNSDEVQSMMTQ